MAMYPNDAAGMERAVANAIHEHWKLFLIEGIILVILGMIAIAVPVVRDVVRSPSSSAGCS